MSFPSWVTKTVPSTCTSSHTVRGRGRARRGPRPPQRTTTRSAGLVVGAARTLPARRSLAERAREHRPHLLTRLRGWASRAAASQQVASGAGEARISPLKGAIVPGLATSRPVETPSMAHGLRRERARQEAPAEGRERAARRCACGWRAIAGDKRGWAGCKVACVLTEARRVVPTGGWPLRDRELVACALGGEWAACGAGAGRPARVRQNRAP